MTPQQILDHYDSGQQWAQAPGSMAGLDVPGAYQRALQLRELRRARGELPRGFKIGFTNRTIWPRYNVFAPIWGTVWSSTLSFCEGQSSVALAGLCQPRIEPETVFGMRATPPANASLQELFDSIDWVAPGFEIVQTHLPNWVFTAPDAVADSALHARLLVGHQVPMHEVAENADELEALLSAAQATLFKSGEPVDHGLGANVLGSPLQALHHFLTEMRECPGAPDLLPGDVVTTGTWTDAWPVQAGERWSASFSAPLRALTVDFA